MTTDMDLFEGMFDPEPEDWQPRATEGKADSLYHRKKNFASNPGTPGTEAYTLHIPGAIDNGQPYQRFFALGDNAFHKIDVELQRFFRSNDAPRWGRSLFPFPY